MSELIDKELELFTLEDLINQLGLTPVQARRTAERLVEDHQARRLQRGIYALLHPADWHHREAGYTANWYATAARLIHPRPYHLAFYTAMEIHNMLSHPLLTVLVATTVQKKPVFVSPVRFRFVRIAERRFFGQETREIQPGKAIEVATLERTFIDCVDRPELCGGLEEVLGGFRRRHGELDSDKLLRFLYRLSEPTLTKRLGFLLEVVGHEDKTLLDEMHTMAGRLGHYVPMVPGAVKTQHVWRDKKWELEIDVPVDELRRTGTT
ncbi:MAG: type IV toxin-antitoxin system AbiEi family antitoxin domain-containing protein [Actinomycetota bacterium]